MSLVWIMDDTITNSFLNQENKESIKHNNNPFTKIENNEVHIYKGSLQNFHRVKATHGSIDDVFPHNFAKNIIKN